MTTVGSYEAKTKLADLLRQVERGEHVTITRHGVPVAVLIPFADYPRHDVAATVAELKTQARGRRLGGLSIRELIEEGRRW